MTKMCFLFVNKTQNSATYFLHRHILPNYSILSRNMQYFFEKNSKLSLDKLQTLCYNCHAMSNKPVVALDKNNITSDKERRVITTYYRKLFLTDSKKYIPTLASILSVQRH